jgi:hypothetical protein
MYCALSYCWGSVEDPAEVKVNGARHTISKNLHTFLLSILQNPTAVGNIELFWADQISIDQQNQAERNEQVALMTRIYYEAKVVHAYTGEYSASARNALDAIFPRPGAAPLQGREIEDVVEQFCQREYWYRLWIVQEIYIAKVIKFWCGSYAVSSDISTPVGILETGKFQTRRTPAGQHVAKVQQMQSEYRLGSTRQKPRTAMSLSRAVVIFSDQRCRDPRDKIYGLQAMLHLEQCVKPDYGKTVDEVFEEAVKTFIQHCGRPKTFTNLQCFYNRASHTERDVAVLAEQLLGLRVQDTTDSLLATLCWGHWLLHMPNDKRLPSLGTDLSSWTVIWHAISASAVTHHQKTLAADLRERFSTLHRRWNTSERQTSVNNFRTLTSDLQELLKDAVTACGFTEVSSLPLSKVHGFLIHPGDPPLPWREAMAAT